MIDPRTAIGEVHLTISDLDRSLRFYENQLGFTLHTRIDRIARLGAGHGAAAVVDRLRAAAVPFESTAEGVLVHDPAGNAILLKTVA